MIPTIGVAGTLPMLTDRAFELLTNRLRETGTYVIVSDEISDYTIAYRRKRLTYQYLTLGITNTPRAGEE